MDYHQWNKKHPLWVLWFFDTNELIIRVDIFFVQDSAYGLRAMIWCDSMPSLMMRAWKYWYIPCWIVTTKTARLFVMTRVRYTVISTLFAHLASESSHCPGIPVGLGCRGEGRKLSDSFPVRLAGVGSPNGSWVMWNFFGSCTRKYSTFSSCRWDFRHRSEHTGMSVCCSENGNTLPQTEHVVMVDVPTNRGEFEGCRFGPHSLSLRSRRLGLRS